MLDVALLRKPLDDLAATVGTGQCVCADPVRELNAASSAMHDISASGMSSVDRLAGAWTGESANAAIHKGREFAFAAEQLGAQGGNLSFSWLNAAESVLRGAGELAGIGASFLRVLQQAEVLLSHPLGQLALLREALDHLSRAIDVVLRLSAELSANAHGLQSIGTGVAIPSAPVVGGGDEQFALAAATGSAGMSGSGVDVQLPDGSVSRAPNPQAAEAVRNALSQRGVPYVWGGTTPGAGFDCSGLTQWSYAQAGVEIPRLAQEQKIGTPVSANDLMAGDLVVWDGHVAMAIGNGQMVEAGNPVSISPIRTDNMGQAFYGFYRPTA